ncbi:MAG: isoaspartyl peptidase/L-asparaginase [Bacteroidota bacterium]
MRLALLFCLLLPTSLMAQPNPPDTLPASVEPRAVLVIHGGAGTIRRDLLDEASEASIRAALTTALEAGYAEIQGGASAMDAVTAAITVLEDSPRFNAGRGAVFTADGYAELDASIMDGATGEAGAISGVRHVKNPILLAREVMTSSPHVLLSGDGAEEFALLRGLDLVPNRHFHTDARREALRRVLDQQRAQQQSESGAADHEAIPERAVPEWQLEHPAPWRMTGTVGAVALDNDGHLAAGTSTGGMTAKRYGRIGDSPIIGAGTFANEAVGVSSTGHGEYFIRNVTAYDIAARMRYLGESLAQAAEAVIHETLTESGGTGGVIALGADGTVTMPFNTPGMYRGYIDEDGTVTVLLYRDE